MMTLYLLFTCSLFCPFNATNAPGIFSYKVKNKHLNFHAAKQRNTTEDETETETLLAR